MDVKCITNNVDDLPELYRDKMIGINEDMFIPLTTGNVYRVYVIAFRRKQVLYGVCDDDYQRSLGLYYPIFMPAPLFEITDPSISRYWKFKLTPSNKDHHAILAFPEWLDEEYFYDRLTDLDRNAVELFREYMKKIDLE